MKSPKVLLLFVAGIIFALLTSNSIRYACAQQDKDTGLKIGFVNLKNIFRDYKKVKEMEVDINRETESELSKIKELEEQVKQLRDEIPLYRPGSPIRKRKEQELTDKLFEIKFKKDKASYFFAEKMKAGIEKVYQEICQEIEQYAKNNDFYMIIKVSDADFFGTQSADALRMEINTREVLYWGKKHDISNLLLTEINKKYQAEKTAIEKKPGESK
jgi:Skp family chaperone for outer membrane proteins